MKANSSLTNYRFCIFDSCTDRNTLGSAIRITFALESQKHLRIEDGSICSCGKIQSATVNCANFMYYLTLKYTNFTDNKSYDTSVFQMYLELWHRLTFKTYYCNIVNNEAPQRCFSLSGHTCGFINYSNFINYSVENDDDYFIIETVFNILNVTKCALLQNSVYVIGFGYHETPFLYFSLSDCYIDSISFPDQYYEEYMSDRYYINNESSINHTNEMKIINLNRCLEPLLIYGNIQAFCPSKGYIYYYRQYLLLHYISILF